MEQISQRKKRPGRTLKATFILMCGVAGLLIYSPGGGSHAQQERDRQLVQTDSPGVGNSKRIALVIGNGTYTNAPPLKNPPNDATDMADALSKVGFTVEHGVNLTQRQMKFMIREFGKKLKGGGQGLFYFAGHGVQLRGRNYLIPIDADIQSETDVEDQGVDTNLVMGLMDEASNGLNVVILDACRNNPFARSFRSATNGLAQVDAPTGTLIAYATAPGRVARDGVGRNGIYTAELLRQIRVPGLGIEELLKRVRANLKQQTNGEQVPWESSSLVGDFYLNRPADASDAKVNSTGGTSSLDSTAVEITFWETIKNSTDPEDYMAYLEKYPNGQFTAIAKKRAQSKALQPKTNPPLPSNEPLAPLTFKVNARALADNTANGWNNSGFVVQRGQHLNISAKGSIDLGNSKFSPPEGISGGGNDRLIRNKPMGALVAVIGDDNDDFIFIGNGREFTADRDGVLFLGVNENKLDDNLGAFEVIIEAEIFPSLSVISGTSPAKPQPVLSNQLEVSQSTVTLMRGYRTGYSDGYQAGLLDKTKGLNRDYWNKEYYLKADRGFETRYGLLEAYRDGYQQGFEEGYDAGFDGRDFHFTSPPNLTNRGTVGRRP